MMHKIKRLIETAGQTAVKTDKWDHLLLTIPHLRDKVERALPNIKAKKLTSVYRMTQAVGHEDRLWEPHGAAFLSTGTKSFYAGKYRRISAVMVLTDKAEFAEFFIFQPGTTMTPIVRLS